MAGERKVIRDAIIAVVKGSVSCEFFSSRNIDAREVDEFVNVYFESGDIQYDGIKNFTTAQLVIGYHIRDLVEDDQIDEIADSIHGALETQDIAPQLIQGFVPSGWEYQSDRESAFSGIYLRYTVTY